MKRSTLSILAVALSTTSCGPSPELDKLNDELSNTSMSQALSNSAHFRPLCDERGYPLVGNINAKSLSTASRFCAEVRTLEKKR